MGRRIRQAINSDEQRTPPTPEPAKPFVQTIAPPSPKSRATRVRPTRERHITEVVEIPGISSGAPKGEIIRRHRAQEEMLRACVAEGHSRAEIKKIFGMTDKELGVIEKRLMADDGLTYTNMSTAHRFYNYTLQQEQLVRDLEYLLSMMIAEMEVYETAYADHNRYANHDKDGNITGYSLPPKPSYQAAVTAIKAKSDILDRTIKMGQELGIIEKRAKELRLSGGINLAAIPTDELKDMFAKKLDQFQDLCGKGSIPQAYRAMIERKRNES